MRSEDGVEIIEVQVPWSVNMLIDDDIVPFTSCGNEDKKGSVVLTRKKHSVELGFAVTYHKVQGQTLDSVILLLHKRTSRQILSL